MDAYCYTCCTNSTRHATHKNSVPGRVFYFNNITKLADQAIYNK
jgi:hypothetical protein